MDKKQWLSRGRNLEKEITALMQAKKIAMSQVTRVNSVIKDISVSSGPNNTQEARLVKYVELENMIDKRIEALQQIKVEILKAVQSVEHTELRALLIQRYINFKTWEQIAEDMNYSWKQIFNLHAKALQEIKTT